VDLGLHIIVGGAVEDARVADVGAVEIAEEIDAGREREDPEVLLADEGALLLVRVRDGGGDLGGPFMLAALMY
jgi:hypothetical protein